MTMSKRAQSVRARLRLGFTIVELLLVVIALGVIASLVVPSLANATAPIPRPIADLLQHDLRRARIESIGSVREMQLIIGQERDRWWLQPASAPDANAALLSSLRVLGQGNLAPFEGLRFELRVDGATPPRAHTPIATYSSQGARDRRQVDLTLLQPLDERAIARWRLEPQRSRLIDVDIEDEDESAELAETATIESGR